MSAKSRSGAEVDCEERFARLDDVAHVVDEPHRRAVRHFGRLDLGDDLVKRVLVALKRRQTRPHTRPGRGIQRTPRLVIRRPVGRRYIVDLTLERSAKVHAVDARALVRQTAPHSRGRAKRRRSL